MECVEKLDWIADFLSGRSQHVVSGGYSSESVSVINGILQGRPLIFLMCINDITQHLSSSCRPFADDCVFYKRIDSANNLDLLQQELRQLKFGKKHGK